jgi:hypothetical protein
MRDLRFVMISGLLLAGCAAPEVPSPVAKPPTPSHAASRPVPLDWFQQQLVAARAAQRSYTPKSDKEGAQAAYDQVMRNACGRVVLSGPDKYKPRCNALLERPVSAPQPDPFKCDSDPDSPADIVACND